MSVKKILYVFTQAPYSNSTGQEALDALLIGAAFEQEVSALFIHNGVFQLKGQQNTTLSSDADMALKPFTKAFKALEDFGVEHIYIDGLSLLSRGLTAEQLMIEAQVLESKQVSQLMGEQFRVFTF